MWPCEWIKFLPVKCFCHKRVTIMSFGPVPGSPFGPPPTGQSPQIVPAPFPPSQFSDNPYAAPSVPAGYTQAFVPGQMPPGAGVWRQGKLLVMHISASLPPVCVKSNQPAAAPLLRKLQWHSPWAYLGLLGGLPPFVILALVLTKRASINIGLSQEWIDRRKRRMLVAWLIGLGSVLVGVLVLVCRASTTARCCS